MVCGFKNVYDCVKALSETDFREDLKGIDVPVLVLHGTDDQVAPIEVTGRQSMKFLKHGTLKEIEGAPHALPTICIEDVNKALLSFLES